MPTRAHALADRIEQGAAALAAFAGTLSEQQWRLKVQPDGRTVGVIVHHVASMYPIEVELAQVLAGGSPVEGVTWQAVADINANHARDHAGVDKASTLELLCADLGIGATEVVAFGDMPNDLPMLSWAGTAYAMADAHPTVTAAADHVAPGHDEDGVATVLAGIFDL